MSFEVSGPCTVSMNGVPIGEVGQWIIEPLPMSTEPPLSSIEQAMMDRILDTFGVPPHLAMDPRFYIDPKSLDIPEEPRPRRRIWLGDK